MKNSIIWYLGISLIPVLTFGQETAAPPPPATTAPEEEEVFVMSPFEVSGERDTGYLAETTLAGTRLRTNLRDLAAPISVVTAQFLTDTNSRSNTDLLKYTTNTEVGGIYGNYGGFGNGQGLVEDNSLLRPNNNTRIRGLEQADGTRNFFLSDIPWDSYNTDRVDIQRGPNSILFGVGSPAGIINGSTIVARLNEDGGTVENEIDKFGSVRFSLDYNKVLIDEELGVRVAGLYNERKFRQEPAFSDDQRLFGTITYQPQLIKAYDAGRLVIKASYEVADIEANNPRVLPPNDFISLWFDDVAGDGVSDPWGMERAVYDTYLLESGGFGSASRGFNGSVKDPYYVPAYAGIDGGPLNNGGVGFFYRNGDSNPFLMSRTNPREFPHAIGPDGQFDNTVGIPFGSMLRSAGWNAYANAIDRIDTREGRPSRFPLAARNYYKDRSMTDTAIFDFFDNLIDGENKRELSEWDSQNVSISQTILENRVGVEFVYDLQDYREARSGMAWSSPYIAIEANRNLLTQLPSYSLDEDGLILLDSYTVPGASLNPENNAYNPNAGSAIAASNGTNNNLSTRIERENMRLTAFGEVKGSDFFEEDSFLAKILGRNVFTGLYASEDRRYTDSRWRSFAMDLPWAESLATSANTTLDSAFRQIVPIVYLSGPLTNVTSASGLNLPRVTSVVNPAGSFQPEYFDSRWNRPTDPEAQGYVDPAAEFINLFGVASTQSENPANYVGWTNKAATVLNASNGDIRDLYTDFIVREEEIESIGFTWQGHLLNGTIVPTVGWRRDELTPFSGSGAKNSSGVASTDAVVTQSGEVNEGDTLSWGVVGHVPTEWTEDFLGGTRLSGYYFQGENAKVQTRYNFDGSPLPNPSAESEDYGIMITTLNDRLSVKIGRYETSVTNGNLPGDASLLGANQYYIAQLPAWGTSSAIIDFFGHRGLDPNQSWYWNWVAMDGGPNLDPSSDEFNNHPTTIRQKAAMDAWIATMDQSFFDAYDIPANVSAIQAAYASGSADQMIAALGGVQRPGDYTTAISSRSNATINGTAPNGTIDNTSKGWEIEVNYRPTPNWNIQVNASYTDAYREALGADLTAFIEEQYERFKGPAGDLRLWWGGDNSIRRYYEDNIISAVEFQNESIGAQAPELRPWQAAAITNYQFTEGRIKGLNVGGAWRYQDPQILGYMMKDDLSGLDVNKPIEGSAEGSVDLWVGYNMNITDKINWKIQANLRNVGQSAELIPISANPDGSPAAQRIREGMTWTLTNTFKF